MKSQAKHLSPQSLNTMLESLNVNSWIQDIERSQINHEMEFLKPNAKDLYVVHCTNFIPKVELNGFRIHPRLNVKHINISLSRPTVHFSLNHCVQRHKDYTGKNRYAIIDPFQPEKHDGGVIEDIFTIGPYKLSPNAKIIIPSSDRELAKHVPKEMLIIFNEQESTLEEQVSHYLFSKGSFIIKPQEKDEVQLVCQTSRNLYIKNSDALPPRDNFMALNIDVSPAYYMELYLQQIIMNYIQNGLVISQEEALSTIDEFIKVIKKYHPGCDHEFLTSYWATAEKIFTEGLTTKLANLISSYDYRVAQEELPYRAQILKKYGVEELQAYSTVVNDCYFGIMFKIKDPSVFKDCKFARIEDDLVVIPKFNNLTKEQDQELYSILSKARHETQALRVLH